MKVLELLLDRLIATRPLRWANLIGCESPKLLKTSQWARHREVSMLWQWGLSKTRHLFAISSETVSLVFDKCLGHEGQLQGAVELSSRHWGQRV